jgi:hypothetical protein
VGPTAPVQRIADRLAAALVYFALLAAILTFIVTRNLTEYTGRCFTFCTGNRFYKPLAAGVEDSSRLVSRKDESAPITVIALSPPVPFHLGKVKSSTSALTRSF